MKKTYQINAIKTYTRNKTISISERTSRSTSLLNSFFVNSSNVFLFIFKIIKNTFSPEFEFKEFLKHCFQIGNKSFTLISVTGAIIGLVLTIQSRPVLIKFGALNMLPNMVTISLIEEWGLLLLH